MPGKTKAELAAENERLRVRLAELEHRHAGSAQADTGARALQLEAVRAVGEEITREVRLPRLLELIIQHAVRLVGGAHGSVLLWDEKRRVLMPAVWVGQVPLSRGTGVGLGMGVIGTVAARRKGMVVNDYRNAPFARPVVLEQTEITAAMAEPLLYQDRLIGVIGINNGDTGRTFTEEHGELLHLFATHAAIAIENARVHEASLRRGEQLEALLRASRTVMAGLDLQTTLERIAAEASRIAGSEHVKVLLVDRDARMLRVSLAHGMAAPPGFPWPLDYGLSGRVAQTGRPVFVADSQDPAQNPAADHDRAMGLRTYLGLPIKSHHQTLGVLTFNTTEPREYSAEEMAYLSSFADQAAIAIENARLFTEAKRELAERTHAEAALREKTEELDRFFTMALDLLCIADTESYFRRVNPAWTAVLGYAPQELEGQRFLDFVHPDDLPATLAALGDLGAQKPVLNFVNRYRHRDGSYRWIEWRSCPYQGTLIYAAARDITERKRAEEQRHRIDIQMQHAQKLESLGVLAGGIAHDFNNLLVAILGHAELTRLQLPPDAAVRGHLQEIENASHRAADLCKQMLAYSGKGRFVVEAIDLSETVHEMTHILEVAISKKASLQFHLASELPAIQADATQIRQVVMNLITNASEAIGDHPGIIRVVTGVTDCDRAYLQDLSLANELAEGRYVHLEVSDSGCGMDEATLGRIFDPFFSTKFAGRGLGLAAVLGIVRGHKGGIKVYSEVGKGTTFKLLFPASAEPADRVRAATHAEDTWQGAGLVLLVDDEDSVRNTGRKILEWLGFSVITAADGLDALEVFRERARDVVCVLLDLTMPHMDGEETLRELRRIRPDVRVVLSSGYNQQDITQRFAGKRLAGFIQKPYTVEELRRTLRAAGPSPGSAG